MKKWIWIVVAAMSAVIVMYYAYLTYNRFVGMEEKAGIAWANVETQYQRRSDLIPNLVNTVKGYADHERETLEGVMEARAKATSVNFSAEELTPEIMNRYQLAQDGISSALGRLLVAVERYPDLKADRNFQELQAQLEGTENRIAVARENYNAAVQAYNVAVRRFPAVVMAKLYGFGRKPYFEATAQAAEVPVVEF